MMMIHPTRWTWRIMVSSYLSFKCVPSNWLIFHVTDTIDVMVERTPYSISSLVLSPSSIGVSDVRSLGPFFSVAEVGGSRQL